MHCQTVSVHYSRLCGHTAHGYRYPEEVTGVEGERCLWGQIQSDSAVRYNENGFKHVFLCIHTTPS